MASKATYDIERLKALSRALLASARDGEWETAASLEAERRPLLYRIFGEIPPGTHLQHQTLLNEVLLADRKIMDLAKQRQGELGSMLRQVGQGRSALRAYENNR